MEIKKVELVQEFKDLLENFNGNNEEDVKSRILKKIKDKENFEISIVTLYEKLKFGIKGVKPDGTAVIWTEFQYTQYDDVTEFMVEGNDWFGYDIIPESLVLNKKTGELRKNYFKNKPATGEFYYYTTRETENDFRCMQPLPYSTQHVNKEVYYCRSKK